MAGTPPDAVTLHATALRLRGEGRATDALASCEKALSILEREVAPTSPDVATVLITLGNVHEDLADYRAAETAYTRALAIVGEIDSGEEIIVRLRVRALASRGRLERVLGRLGDAEATLLGALDAGASLPSGDAQTAALRNDLAVVYKYAGRFDDAEALYREALADIEQALGAEHVEAATLWHNLGGIEHARGRFAEGEPYARRSVEIREAALGPDHPAVAADVAALAALVQGQGRLDEAEALYRRAMSIFERALGPDHHELAVNSNNLGALQAARGETKQAEELYHRALRIKESLLGPDHPDVAMSVHNLAVLHAGTGRTAAARTGFARALAIFEAALGADHPKTRAARTELEKITAENDEPPAGRGLRTSG